MFLRSFRRSLNPAIPSFLGSHHLIQPYPQPITNHIPFSFNPAYYPHSFPFSSHSSQTTPTQSNHHGAEDEFGDGSFDDAEDFRPAELSGYTDDGVEKVMSSMCDFGSDAAESKRRLEACGVPASPELVTAVLSRLRNDWAAAFTFFLWAGKQPGYAHSVHEYHSMISILGKMRRFDTAWALIDEMRGGRPARPGPPILTPQTLLILIRRYCAAHEVGKAINAFYTLKRFGFTPGIEDFQGLLGALCRYKNVEDAEHLLMCNEKVFPFETKSFNIVLNGWCNVVVCLREAKRFWKFMANKGIQQDAVSYGSMISAFSKAGNLNDVLKLFNKMKDLDIAPDRKIYNAVVYALAKGQCIEEAKALIKTMEEKGAVPNAVTFNSLIKPLCKARRMDDAWAMFDEMLRRGLAPCIRTYHAFFDILKTPEEVFELLDRMKRAGCRPVIETYIMLIRKLCRWKQHESVLKLWNEMRDDGLSPDRSAYIVLVHGFFLNGKLDEAAKYYEEMKSKGIPPERKTDEMIQAWLSGKDIVDNSRSVEMGGSKTAHDTLKSKREPSKTSRLRRDYLKGPEIRSVRREGGFSFW